MARKNKSNGGKSSGFITNLRRSTGSLAKETAKELMPNLSATIKSNARFIKTTYQDTSYKFRETDLKESYLFKSGNDLIKNAISDIKTGNIDNQKRQKKNSQDIFTKMLNFDFDSEDDLSDMFADDQSSPEESLSDLSNLSLNLDEDTKSDIKTMANFSQANTKITNRGFAAINSQLRSISTFQNQNTLKFYEMVEAKLNSLENHMSISSAYYKDLVENTNRKQQDVKSNSLEAAFEMKGFNIEDYVEIYKENFKSMFEAGSMVGTMMIKPIIADIVNNPLGSLAKMGMKSLIPKGIKNSLKDLDSTIGALPILIQGRIPSMKKKGGIWEILGNLLDLDKSKIKAKKNEFVKGPIPFDGVTKRAITHVIPGYLKRILFALTGNEKDNVVYDMDTGKFITEKEAKRGYRERFERSRRSAIDDNIGSLENEYVKALKAKKVIKNDSEAGEYLEELRNSLSNLSKSGKTLASDIKASDLSSNKKTAKILKDVIDSLDSKSFTETNKALANAHMQYQQELRGAVSEDLWASTFDRVARVNRSKKTKENPIFESIDKMTNKKGDSLFKKFVLDKIKNDKVREQMAWMDKETADGKNETLEKFSERVIGNFRGNIEFDKSDFKKKRKPSPKKTADQTSSYLGILQMVGANTDDPAVKKVLSSISNGKDPSTFKATINRLITGAKGGINFANQGLMQYMSMTPEGLALRVKIADGTTVPTTEGPNDPKTVEKNIKNKQKAKRKLSKSDGRVINLKDYKRKSAANASSSSDEMQMEQNLPMVVGDNGTNGIIENSFDPRYTVFGELFNDLTGSELTKAGVGGLVVSGARSMVSNTRYGDLALKYGDRAYEYGKDYAKKKNLWQRFKKSSLGQGIKRLRDGSKIFGGKLSDKLLDNSGAFYATGLDLLNFAGDRAGINKESLLSGGKNLLNYTGDKLGNLVGGLGDVLGGKKTIKSGIKDLAKGSWSTFKDVKRTAFKGLGKAGNIFKNGGLKEMVNIIKTKRKRVKPTEDPSTNLLLASNSMTESVSNSAQVLQLASTSVATTIENATEKMTKNIEDFSDAIEVSSYRIVESNEDSNNGLTENVVGEVLSGNPLSVLGDSKSGKKGIFGKLGGLLGKGKGLAGKAFGAVKGAGILGKLGGIASGIGGLASGIGGLASSAGGSLLGLLGGSPILAGLAPMLGPALAVGAGAFGISKIFKGIKARKEEKRAQYYDENGNYKTDAEGRSVEKKGFFSRLFAQPLSNKKLDKLNQAVPVTIIDKYEDSNHTAEEQKEARKAKLMSDITKFSNPRSGLGLLGGLFGIGRNTNKDVNGMATASATQMAMMGNPSVMGMNTMMNHTPAGMITKGFTNTFVKTAYADGNPSVSSESKQDNSSLVSENPNERIAAYTKPWGEYVMSPTFGNIFGANGLFGAMYKGLKKAAGGGGVSKLTEFFKNFWTNASNPGGSTNADGTADFSIDGETMTADNYLGMYSNQHEGDVGTISSGIGDPGGPSYGIPQFPLRQGTPQKFIDWMKTQDEYKDIAAKFEGKTQGSASFNQTWKEIASSDKDRFGQAQVKYATVMDLEPFLKIDKSGVDWNRSRALQEVAYSRTVHNGPAGFASITKNTGVNNSMTDAEIITRIYDYTRDNVGTYWRSSSSTVQSSIRDRMVKEKQTMLELAATNKAPIDWKGDGSISGTATASSGTFTQPVPGHTSISSGFGNRIHPVTKKQSFHSGIDIPAPNGTKIVASDSGTVTFAGNLDSYGKLVKIDHNNGYETRYAHCSSIDVKKGASVSKGQAIAKVGSTGRSTGNHLHFEIRKKGSAINPVNYLNKSTSGGGAKGGPDTATPISSFGESSVIGLDSAMKQVSRTMSKYNIVVDPEFESGTQSSTTSSYSVNNNQAFRDETRNNIMLKLKDAVETICQNTGKTNEILANILQKISESGNIDSPLQLNAELASIYKGF